MFKRAIYEEHRVPADIEHLKELRDFITRTGRKYGVSERIINAFKLAVDEAGTNIIRHAYRDWKGDITIRMVIKEKNITVSLIDKGHSFDPNKVSDPDLKRYIDIGKKGGLGIFIMRRMIDDIDYRKTVDGNELRLIKNRDAAPVRRFWLPDLSLSMKMKFSLIGSAILTSLALVWFVRLYIQQESRILNSEFEVGGALSKFIAISSVDHIANDNTWDLCALAAKSYRDHSPLTVEALIVDTTSQIVGANLTDILLLQYRMPPDARRVDKNIYEYTLPDSLSVLAGRKVYDVVCPIVSSVEGEEQRLGSVHLLLDRRIISNKIRSARLRLMWISALILLAGYIGVFILVYFTMSPFKKLSRWVRDLGQGKAQDEMEFDSSDEIGEIAQAFSDITERFRKSQESLAEKERLQKEMQVAQEIQHTLLPAAFPEIEGFEIGSYYEAAKEVGGDYFDFVEVDRDTMGIVVADVSGKGVPGSLVMTMIRTALRTEARGNKDPADVLARVNDFVINDMKRGMFVTVFYIILDSHNRAIHYASAGHNPMILYRGVTKKSYYLNPRGFPIGINLPDRSLFRKYIQSDSLRLREGDLLILYTDGITEAINQRRDQFGVERFLTAIRKYGHLKAGPFVERIKEEIKDFTEGYAQSDDITLVVIKEKLKVEDVLFNLRSKLIKMVNEEGMSVKAACNKVGVSTSTYYKYKKIYDSVGVNGLKEKVGRSEVEERHISIEDKAKIIDIIKNNPEYGAKRISEELKTERYGNTEIDPRRIYEELVRSRLNTKELRMIFVERGDKGKPMKPPGTPLLTLDGRVIMESKEKREVDIYRPPEVIKKEEEKKVEDIIEERSREIEKEKELFSTEEQAIKEQDLGLIDFSEFLEGDIGPDSMSDTLFVDEGESESLEEKEEKIDTREEVINEPDETQDIETIEDNITDSIADELIGEEIGVSDVTEQEELEQSLDDEGFIETMEELGFERRTMLSHGESIEGGDEESSSLRKKRFIEAGLWFYRNGQYRRAIEQFNKALEEDRNFQQACQYLGDTFFKMGRLDEARKAYERARELDPNNEYVLENLGVVFANKGDYKKAVLQWGEVLKRNPERRDIIERIIRMQKLIRQKV